MKERITAILKDLDCQRLSVEEAYDKIMEELHGPDEVIEIELSPVNLDRELEELR